MLKEEYLVIHNKKFSMHDKIKVAYANIRDKQERWKVRWGRCLRIVNLKGNSTPEITWF